MCHLGEQPRHGRWMHPEQPGGIGGSLAARLHEVDDFLLLLRGQLGASAPDPAFLPGGFKPATGALAEHGPLELGERADNLHHHPPGGSGGVNGLGKALEGGPCPFDLIEDEQQVFERPGEPVELPDDQHVPLAQVVKQALQLGPIPAPPGSHLLKDSFTPGSLKRANLEDGILVLGGNAGVADAHGCKILLPFGFTLQRVFATHKPLQSVGRVGIAPRNSFAIRQCVFVYPHICAGVGWYFDERSDMSRLTIEVTEQQHQSLKVMAALQGKSIREYALERLFPPASDEEQTFRDLKTLLEQRIAESQKGEVVARSLTEIAEDALKSGGRA